jgi:hypothetical protein
LAELLIVQGCGLTRADSSGSIQGAHFRVSLYFYELGE